MLLNDVTLSKDSFISIFCFFHSPAQSKTQSLTGPTYLGETLNPEAMFFLIFFNQTGQSCLELQEQMEDEFRSDLYY